MFKRVFVEDWAQNIPVIAFFIFAIVFLLVSIRAIRLEKKERERMASLPLDKPADSRFSKTSNRQNQ